MNWEELVKKIDDLNHCNSVEEFQEKLDPEELKGLVTEWNKLIENTDGPDRRQTGFGFILRSMRRLVLAKSEDAQIPELKWK